MISYYGIIGVITVFWVIISASGRTKSKDQLYLILSFGLLAFISAIRYDVGYDYSFVYAPNFERIIMDPAYSFSETRFEPGYVCLEKLVAFFSHNYQSIFIVTSIIIIGLLFAYHWFNSKNPWISIFLFLALSQFYLTMNFMRQSMAATITTLAFPLLKKRKPLHLFLYLLIVLFAATFHKSALIMLAFVFINLLPVQNKWILLGYSIIVGLIFINSELLIEIGINYIFPSYDVHHGTSLSVGFSPIFTVSFIVAFLVIFFNSKRIIAKDKGNYLYINYAFFALVFAAFGTKHSIIDRFAIYFLFTIPIAFSIIWDELSKTEDGTFILKIKDKKYLPQKINFSIIAVIVIVGGLAIHQFALSEGHDHHGVVPYKVIWDQPFYVEYKEYLKNYEAYAGDEPVLDLSELDLKDLEPVFIRDESVI